MAQEKRPKFERNIPVHINCRRKYGPQYEAVESPPVQTANGDDISRESGGFQSIGSVRKTELGQWVVEAHHGNRRVELPAANVVQPGEQQTELSGQIYKVTNVTFQD